MSGYNRTANCNSPMNNHVTNIGCPKAQQRAQHLTAGYPPWNNLSANLTSDYSINPAANVHQDTLGRNNLLLQQPFDNNISGSAFAPQPNSGLCSQPIVFHHNPATTPDFINSTNQQGMFQTTDELPPHHIARNVEQNAYQNDHLDNYRPNEPAPNRWSGNQSAYRSGCVTPSSMSEFSLSSRANSYESLESLGLKSIPGGADSDMFQNEPFFRDVLVRNCVESLFLADPTTASQAARTLRQIAHTEFKVVMFRSPETLRSILHKVNVSTDVTCSELLLKTLFKFSETGEGCEALIDADVTGVLIKVLSSNIEQLQFLAASIIHDLVTCPGVTEVGVAKVIGSAIGSGGIDILVRLLGIRNEKFLAIDLHCLNVMFSRNEMAKSIILSGGFLVEIVRILKTCSYEKLLRIISKFIRDISRNCKQAKVPLVTAGGMAALAMHLKGPNGLVTRNCLWSLRNLSDSVDQNENVEQVLRCLAEILDNGDPGVVKCAAQTLANVTCQSLDSRTLLRRIGGVSLLVGSMLKFKNGEDLEPAICALRHLTSRHSEADVAQSETERHNLIRLLMDVLGPPSPHVQTAGWGLARAVLGLVRNLTLSTGSQSQMKKCGGVFKVAQVLFRACQDALQTTSSRSCEEETLMLENVLSDALFILRIMSAKDAQVKESISNMYYLPQILNTLQQHQNKVVAQGAAALWTDLVSESPSRDCLQTPINPDYLSVQPASHGVHGKHKAVSTQFVLSSGIERPYKIQKTVASQDVGQLPNSDSHNININNSAGRTGHPRHPSHPVPEPGCPKPPGIANPPPRMQFNNPNNHPINCNFVEASNAPQALYFRPNQIGLRSTSYVHEPAYIQPDSGRYLPENASNPTTDNADCLDRYLPKTDMTVVDHTVTNSEFTYTSL